VTVEDITKRLSVDSSVSVAIGIDTGGKCRGIWILVLVSTIEQGSFNPVTFLHPESEGQSNHSLIHGLPNLDVCAGATDIPGYSINSLYTIEISHGWVAKGF
jgi:hypothetical protein